MNPPLPPPDDREARLTALLLGELPDAEAAALRQELERDADLRRLHDRLSLTLGLVREAVAAPDQETVPGPDAPRLPAERREQLLARFKVVPVKPSRWREWRRQHGREVAALAAMLMALLLIAAVLSSKPDSSGYVYADSRRNGLAPEGLLFGDVEVPAKRFQLFRRSSAEPAAATAAGEPPVLAERGFTAMLWGRSDASKSDTEKATLLAESLSDRPTSTPAPVDAARKYAEGEVAQSMRSGLAAGSGPSTDRARRLASIALPAADDAVVTSGEVAWQDRSGAEAKAGDSFWFGSVASSGNVRNQATADAGVTDLALVPATPSIQPVPPPPPSPADVPAPTPAPTVADPAANLGFGEVDRQSGLAANRPMPATRSLSEITVMEKKLRDAAPAGVAQWRQFSPSGPAEPKAEDFVAGRFARVAPTPSQPAPAPTTPPVAAPPPLTTPAPVAGQPAAAELAQAGKLYFEAGRFDLAEAKLREASKADPANAGAAYFLDVVEARKQQESAELAGREAVIGVQSPSPQNRITAAPGALPHVAMAGTPPPILPANPTADNLAYFAKGMKVQTGLDQKAASAKPAATPDPNAAVAVDAFITANQENQLGLQANYAYSGTITNSVVNSFHDFSPAAGYGIGGGGGAQNWAMQGQLAGKDAAPQSAQGRSSFVSRLHSRVESRAKAPADASAPGALDAVQMRLWDTDSDGAVTLDRGEVALVNKAEKQFMLAKEKAASAGAQPQSRGRVEIALPAGERGEVRESLRLANGPVSAVVVNESMGRTPSDARRESEFVSLGDQVMDGTVVAGVPVQAAGALGVAPAKPAPNRPPVLLGARLAGRAGEGVEARKSGETGKRDTPGSASELARLTKELESLNYVRGRLAAKIANDEREARLPREGIVELVQPAEVSQQGKPSLGQRVQGLFNNSVTRSARVAVEKDATDIEGLGTRQVDGFDPLWAKTEAERMRSRQFLGKVVEKLKLNDAWAKEHGGGQPLSTEDSVKVLAKSIEIRQDANGGLFDIRAKGDNAEEAARIANAVAETYREERRALAASMATSGLQVLEQELRQQDSKIAALQEELKRRRNQSASDPAEPAVPKPAPDAPIPQPEMAAADNLFSTFSLNVSDVSFKLAAASLEQGRMPEAASVRTEEFINAFDYRDPEPGGSAPVAFAWERARYPFAQDRDLVRFSVKTAASGRQPGRPLNLVLAIDNSGSMERADRVRILRECLRVLGAQLQPQDRVSVVAFARTARLVVDGLPGGQGAELPERAGDLTPQGGTNLEDAMNVAWQAARRHYVSNGVNRVVLLTDGAANLGDVDPQSLKRRVEAHRQEGFALDCFGIGWEGYNDELLEQLSRNGDGRYGFVNSPEAAATEFAGQLAGALKVAASDVKVQVEWNPRRVTAWRQLGYAKHQLKKEQFRDNTVDAAEIGAAEAGNALYTVQVNPAGEGPLGVVRVRFKVPGTSDYREHEWPLPYAGPARALEQASPALRLAAGASAFSEWLVASPYAAEVTPDKLLGCLRGVPEAWGADRRPARLEWMIRQARSLAGR